jgi:hypothetical protein
MSSRVPTPLAEKPAQAPTWVEPLARPCQVHRCPGAATRTLLLPGGRALSTCGSCRDAYLGRRVGARRGDERRPGSGQPLVVQVDTAHTSSICARRATGGVGAGRRDRLTAPGPVAGQSCQCRLAGDSSRSCSSPVGNLTVTGRLVEASQKPESRLRSPLRTTKAVCARDIQTWQAHVGLRRPEVTQTSRGAVSASTHRVGCRCRCRLVGVQQQPLTNDRKHWTGNGNGLSDRVSHADVQRASRANAAGHP